MNEAIPGEQHPKNTIRRHKKSRNLSKRRTAKPKKTHHTPRRRKRSRSVRDDEEGHLITHSCVQMLNWFHFHGHVCIVFELLGLSTYDFLQENNFYPYPLEQIRHMGWQIFRAVDFLHQSKLIHTDLKPENILFINSEHSVEYNDKMKRYEKKIKNPDVKIADFGNSVYHNEDHSSEIQTRHYRAPEVVLGLKWDQSCDVWSLGCILLEYYLGYVVFMANFSQNCPLPEFVVFTVIQRVTNSSFYCKTCQTLKILSQKNSDHIAFFDLIQKTLEYDSEKRISPSEVLKHLFFHPLQQTSP
uniref:dual-specificity kinase n=1 Tax=Erpetoichthys calabaricus TaxID=27687 RepID=A0A8C4RXX2_ERPCA